MVVIAAVIELVDVPALIALYRTYTRRLGTEYGWVARPDFIAAIAALLGVTVFDIAGAAQRGIQDQCARPGRRRGRRPARRPRSSRTPGPRVRAPLRPSGRRRGRCQATGGDTRAATGRAAPSTRA